MKALLKRPGLFVTTQLLAVAIGVTLAFAAKAADGVNVAQAANHCTRYAPTWTQDYNCYVYGEIQAGYSTPGVAQRDQNRISICCDREWQVYYRDSSDTTTSGLNYGFGLGGASGSSGSVHAYARCVLVGSLVPGACWTEWHD